MNLLAELFQVTVYAAAHFHLHPADLMQRPFMQNPLEIDAYEPLHHLVENGIGHRYDVHPEIIAFLRVVERYSRPDDQKGIF